MIETASDSNHQPQMAPPTSESATTTTYRKRVLRELPVKLTDGERLDIAQQKSEAEAELEEILADFAETKREWAQRIELVETRIAKFGAEFREGMQKRPVECQERYVREGEHAGKIETVRFDTGEVVDRRVADLLEARNALPKDDDDDVPNVSDDILAEAARMQREAGVEENDDGDVVVPEGSDKKPKRRSKK